jgi:hypothetical protein
VPPATEGLIYVCVESGGRYAKVGYASSLDHVLSRRCNLQIGNPRALTVLVVGPGDQAAEAALHERFSDHAVRGEWFRIEGAVAETIARSHPPPMRAGTGRPGRPPSKREAARAWLTKRLSDGPLPAGDVFRFAELEGHSIKTIRRAAAELGVTRTPPGGGRLCVWGLA